MPRFDGTGPLGTGPQTGRGLGPCGGGQNRGGGISSGRGRGMGRGRGLGLGRTGVAGLHAREEALKQELAAIQKEKKNLSPESQN